MKKLLIYCLFITFIAQCMSQSYYIGEEKLIEPVMSGDAIFDFGNIEKITKIDYKDMDHYECLNVEDKKRFCILTILTSKSRICDTLSISRHTYAYSYFRDKQFLYIFEQQCHNHNILKKYDISKGQFDLIHESSFDTEENIWEIKMYKRRLSISYIDHHNERVYKNYYIYRYKNANTIRKRITKHLHDTFDISEDMGIRKVIM